MCDNFFKDLYAFIEEKNKEKSEKEKNKKDKKEGNFYKKFRQDFSKEVRYNKIKRYGKQNLPEEYQYMIGLSKPPEKIKMSELSVSIPDIIKNLPDDFKKVYKSTELETKVADLEVKRAGFSFLTSALTNKERFLEIKKLIKSIGAAVPDVFGLNNYDKFSNFVKTKLEYKKDKEAIEALENESQKIIKESKKIIEDFTKIYVEKNWDSKNEKNKNLIIKLKNLIVQVERIEIDKIQNEFFRFSEKKKKLLVEINDWLDNFLHDINGNDTRSILSSFISVIEAIGNILSDVYDTIMEIFSKNQKAKQDEYYECAKQIKEIKNQIIENMNNNKVKDNKKDKNDQAVFIFICTNLKLEYQYLIEKDKSEGGKIDTTKFESDSLLKILLNSVKVMPIFDESGYTNFFGFEENTKAIDKLYLKTNEKYEYKSDSIPPLFSSNDLPNISDIKQGSIGDCYLLAALQSLVGNTQGKQAIKKVFLNEKTANEDEYVKMRFFKLKFTKKDGVMCIEPSGGKTIIKINKEYLIKKKWWLFNEKAYNETAKSCWVDCFEKAFAVYRHDKTNVVVDEQCKEDKKELENLVNSWNRELSLKLSSANINGGHSMIPLAAITGNPYFTFSNDGEKDEKEMYNFFKDNTSNKVISFKEDEIKKISNIGNHLYSTHAYSVLEVCEKNNTITLRNPHNGDGIDLSEALLYNSNSKNIEFNSKKVFINKKNKTKIEKGTVTMRLDVFCKLLNDVEFG